LSAVTLDAPTRSAAQDRHALSRRSAIRMIASLTELTGDAGRIAKGV
jgi:hypothetical protein